MGEGNEPFIKISNVYKEFDGKAVRMVHRISFPASDLSGVEKQRVVLAQILMKEPAIAILDEPTGTMDPITKKFVTESIRAARENLGMTFLIVSHDLDFAYDVCDRIAHMQDGKILSIEELRANLS